MRALEALLRHKERKPAADEGIEEPEDEPRLLLVSNRLPPCDRGGGRGMRGEGRHVVVSVLPLKECGLREGLTKG